MTPHLKRLSALTMAVLLTAIFITHGFPAFFILGFLCLALLAGPAAMRRGQLGAAPDTNDVAADLNLNEIIDAALFAFKRTIIALRVFCTVFRNVQLKGTNIVAVPYYPIQGTTSQDFAGTYTTGSGAGSSTQVRDITINKRKFQPLSLTGEELARLPALNAETIGRLKGQKLAFDVVQDILSVVTNANYGAAVFTGAAGAFDSDNVIDIKTACDTNSVVDESMATVLCPWPEEGRGLLVSPTYDGALLKDHTFSQAYSIGTDQAIRTGRLPNVFGFDYMATASIPGNGENLVGMATFMSAVLCAFSPIAPPPAVRARMTQYEILTDPETDISMEYRVWGDPDTDTEMRVFECNYGYAKGEAAAIKRIVSA